MSLDNVQPLPREEQNLPKRCRYCGEVNLFWRGGASDDWRLFDTDGVAHECAERCHYTDALYPFYASLDSKIPRTLALADFARMVLDITFSGDDAPRRLGMPEIIETVVLSERQLDFFSELHRLAVEDPNGGLPSSNTLEYVARTMSQACFTVMKKSAPSAQDPSSLAPDPPSSARRPRRRLRFSTDPSSG